LQLIDSCAKNGQPQPKVKSSQVESQD